MLKRCLAMLVFLSAPAWGAPKVPSFVVPSGWTRVLPTPDKGVDKVPARELEEIRTGEYLAYATDLAHASAVDPADVLMVSPLPTAKPNFDDAAQRAQLAERSQRAFASRAGKMGKLEHTQVKIAGQAAWRFLFTAEMEGHPLTFLSYVFALDAEHPGIATYIVNTSRFGALRPKLEAIER